MIQPSEFQTNRKRVAASVTVLFLVAAALALVTHATGRFSDTTRAAVLGVQMKNSKACQTRGNTTQCPVDITLTPSSVPGATGLVPGDWVSRDVTLSNTGRTGLSSISLKVSATGGQALVSALQLEVLDCDASGCRSMAGPQPVLYDNVVLTGLDSLRRGGSDTVRLRLSMIDAAGNESGTSTSLTYSFTAVQDTANGGSTR